MDGILVCLDKETHKLTYTAANNEPVLIANNEVLILPKDRMPVGKGEKEIDFKLFEITCKTNDMIYLYTDGYADQFGGPKGKKFKYKQLNDLLDSICNKELNQQKEILQITLNNWRGDLEQVDDILIIGIKV
jgi:serine phosphatase RsbU (regulator of sigma subunit)